jgi:hypothetical protein
MFWIGALICGLITSWIANSKGRTAIGWFFIGFFFGLIGLIICLCMSNLNEEQKYRAQQTEENRRLREKIRQEQLKLESLRMHTASRLDAHDNVLGMDTRATAPQTIGYGSSGAPDAYAPTLPPSAPPPPPPLPPPPQTTVAVGSDPDNPVWYVALQGQQYGPVSKRMLSSMIGTGQFTRDTFVWQESMPNWTEAANVHELESLFA